MKKHEAGTSERKMPINGIVEPDFLKYLEETFTRWKKLWEDGITLGSREIMKFESVLKGARLNAHTGFIPVTNREWNEETKQNHYTMLIYQNQKAMETGQSLYSFDTPILE